MSAPINPNLIDTGTPPIPESYAWAERYDGRAGPLINMAQAAPGEPPHGDLLARFAEGAGEAAGARYGAVLGDDGLREAHAANVSERYGANVTPGEVGITAGCNMAFFITMLSLARAGEAVLLPAPWYFNHQMALQMLGIEARPLPCRPENGFVPRAADAEELLDKKVRAVVLVTPNNPTGAVYPPATIRAFAELCRKRRLWLVMDETYRDLMPEGHDRPHELFTLPWWRDHVIQLYSFSKSYCMPGHRLGAMVAGGALVPEIEKALDTVQICPPRPSQAAVAWGIGALGAWRASNRAEINRRGTVFREALRRSNAWQLDSLGAYFAYVRHPFEGVASAKVAEALVSERGVLALPGSYFGPGQDGHLRIAFANVRTDVIEQLPKRLEGLRV